MIRIAVCDDENVIVNQIEHIISEVCKQESIPVNIDVFYSGRELKRQVTSGTKYDIIFLDIQMKGGDGITAAENIRKVDDNVLLIYGSIVTRVSRFVNEFHILKATFKFCTRLSTFVMTFPFFSLLL